MIKTYEDKILFSWIVALNAIIRITPTSVWIQDTDGTTRTFPGGTAEYQIDVKAKTTRKKAKTKGQIQSITIRKKLPVCPITGLPIELNTGFVFKKGFALNKHVIRFQQHHAYELNSAYYCEIGRNRYYLFYLISKIVDGSKMDTITYNSLSATLNGDIADLIKAKYEEMIRGGFNFKMVETKIVPEKRYHRSAIGMLVEYGLLEIGICSYDFTSSSITMLTQESYNHIFADNRPSILKEIYPSVDAMLERRENIIKSCL